MRSLSQPAPDSASVRYAGVRDGRNSRHERPAVRRRLDLCFDDTPSVLASIPQFKPPESTRRAVPPPERQRTCCEGLDSAERSARELVDDLTWLWKSRDGQHLADTAVHAQLLPALPGHSPAPLLVHFCLVAKRWPALARVLTAIPSAAMAAVRAASDSPMEFAPHVTNMCVSLQAAADSGNHMRGAAGGVLAGLRYCYTAAVRAPGSAPGTLLHPHDVTNLKWLAAATATGAELQDAALFKACSTALSSGCNPSRVDEAAALRLLDNMHELMRGGPSLPCAVRVRAHRSHTVAAPAPKLTASQPSKRKREDKVPSVWAHLPILAARSAWIRDRAADGSTIELPSRVHPTVLKDVIHYL